MSIRTKIGLWTAAIAIATYAFFALGPFTKITIIAAALFIIFGVLPEMRRKKRIKELRENPAELVWIEVCLPPKSFRNANKKMQQFCRKIQSSLSSSKEDMEAGKGRLHIISIAHYSPAHGRPELRWLLGCEAERLSTIERFLDQAFGGLADIRDPEENIMAAIRDAAKRELDREEEENPAAAYEHHEQ